MMFKKIPFIGLAFTLVISCGIFAGCNDMEDCDGVDMNVCDGDDIIVGCTAGSPHKELHKINCKEKLNSNTATCGRLTEPGSSSLTSLTCYEPCKTEGDKEELCIDHTNDAESNYCRLEADGGCGDPSLRPNTYRVNVCKRDPNSGLLYWEKDYEINCLGNNSKTCCQQEGKACDYNSAICDESTNTVLFCNKQNIVERKSCDGADESDFECTFSCL